MKRLTTLVLAVAMLVSLSAVCAAAVTQIVDVRLTVLPYAEIDFPDPFLHLTLDKPMTASADNPKPRTEQPFEVMTNVPVTLSIDTRFPTIGDWNVDGWTLTEDGSGDRELDYSVWIEDSNDNFVGAFSGPGFTGQTVALQGARYYSGKHALKLKLEAYWDENQDWWKIPAGNFDGQVVLTVAGAN